MKKNSIKQTLSRKLGYNVDLNRKALEVKRSFDEISTLLKSEKGTKKK